MSDDTIIMSDFEDDGDLDIDHNMLDACEGDITVTLTDDISSGNIIAANSITVDPSSYNNVGITMNDASMVLGNFEVPAQPAINDGEKTIVGNTNMKDKRNKVYIVEPWQSKNPIAIDDDLHVSLEEDLIPHDELKKKILDKMAETHPETVIKVGIDPDNIKLVKSEVTIEIKKDTKE